MRKLESWGYPAVKTHDRTLSLFHVIPDFVRQADRQTYRRHAAT